MINFPPVLRRRQSVGLLPLILLLVGCPLRDLPPEAELWLQDTNFSDRPPAAAQPTPEDPSSGSEPPRSQEVRERVAEVLRAGRDNRVLSTEVNAAWQIMHGVLAYGHDLKIATPDGEKPAVAYLLGGGHARGLVLRGGDNFLSEGDDPPQQRAVRGVIAEMDPGQKIGQGHRDQWLAYMARCNLQPEDTVVTPDGPLTVEGWVRQMEWDVPRNFEAEYSWTLTALIAHRPTTHRWTARDGLDYSIESLLESEIRQLSPQSACGGSHRLCAIAAALNAHRRAGLPVIGVWAEAQDLVQAAIDISLDLQNADGSFSAHYFDRPGWTFDLSTALGTSGHVFEFLAVAVDDDMLEASWIQDGANFLCRTLELTAEVDLECGALYHALSGLSIYEQRLRMKSEG